MANRTVSPSTHGVRPAMHKMYDGRNVATRPIPVIVDESERRAIAAAAADARPKAESVNWPTSGPTQHIKGAAGVFGTQIASPGNAINGRSGVFNPATGTENFE